MTRTQIVIDAIKDYEEAANKSQYSDTGDMWDLLYWIWAELEAECGCGVSLNKDGSCPSCVADADDNLRDSIRDGEVVA